MRHQLRVKATNKSRRTPYFSSDWFKIHKWHPPQLPQFESDADPGRSIRNDETLMMKGGLTWRRTRHRKRMPNCFRELYGFLFFSNWKVDLTPFWLTLWFFIISWKEIGHYWCLFNGSLIAVSLIFLFKKCTRHKMYHVIDFCLKMIIFTF